MPTQSSQRIVINTIATYARSILAAGLALFSIRWLLNILGQIDYGLLSVVGSIIFSITFLNSVMSGSAARHYAYAIGQGDSVEINNWFNAALTCHLMLASVLTIIGWPIGEYLIANVLNIPASRIVTCLWIFRASLVSAFFSMASIPFVAMFVAKQHMLELAIWSILRSVMVFILAWALRFVSGDRLLFYSITLVTIFISIELGQVLHAFVLFRECNINQPLSFDKKKQQKLFSFAGWNLIGSLGGTFRNHGSALLLNLFYGPKVNAAFGIANQVSGQANTLAAAMLGAFAPEVTASEGRGDRKRMISLSVRSSKFGSILVILFAIPLMIEMDNILILWLKNPPQYTSIFCQLILGVFIIDRLSAGYMLAVQARGKIAAYQATVGASLLLTLPLAWLFFKLGYPPTSVGIAFIITVIICSFGRVVWARHMFGLSIGYWFKSVVSRCGLVALFAGLAALIPKIVFFPSIARLILVIIASMVTCLITSWFIVFDSDERFFIFYNIRRLRLLKRGKASCMENGKMILNSNRNGQKKE